MLKKIKWWHPVLAALAVALVLDMVDLPKGRNCGDAGWLPNGDWSDALFQACEARR